MDVFISWSGESGKVIAEALHDWMGKIFHKMTFWYAGRNIHAGAAWLPELLKQLKKSRVGILCLTPENMTAPWLIFEAGAIWKSLKLSRVVPYCYDLNPDDLDEPLKYLQGVRADKAGTFKLVKSLNEIYEQKYTEKQLDEEFDIKWPKLEIKLRNIDKTQHARKLGFTDLIIGAWWERMFQDEASAISFMEIDSDPKTNAIKIKGKAFEKKEGKYVANWKSIATCIDADAERVFYYWEGKHPTRPNEPYCGFGEIDFEIYQAASKKARGYFIDANEMDPTTTTKKTFKMRRCTDEEVRIMKGLEDDRINELVKKKLKELG